MKVYIQANKQNIPHNINLANAYYGFSEMGFETILFQKPTELSTSNKEDVVVGHIGIIRTRLFELGIKVPEINYPEELKRFLGRKIWTSRINTINEHPELWPVFVKPFEGKKFTGVVVRSPKDLIGCGGNDDNGEVYCSEVINIIAEWRCFVRYGKILAIKPYYGDWHAHYDPSVIEEAVSSYTSAPAGCALDFGVTDKGKTLLIEVNDGYALGCYGLPSIDYAKLESARWAQLTNTVDECNF